MNHHLSRRVVSFVMALILCVGMIPAVSAAEVPYTKEYLNTLMDNWNKSEYAKNKNKAYGGATQCAAFTRYLFDELWSDYDGETNKNNKLMPSGEDDIPCKTEAQTMDYLKKYAKPGDSIRINHHIFHLFDIDTAGNISLYESNFEENSRNKARFATFTLKDLVQGQIQCTTVNKDGTFTKTI